MILNDSPSILSHFSELEDERVDRLKLYPLSEIILLTLCGVICGTESYSDLELFGVSRLDYLRKYSHFTNGIPSRATLCRVFSLLDPEQFKKCFVSWVESFQNVLTEKEVIAIDGKTLRRSFDKAKNNKAIHMVSAFATQAGLVLGQTKIDEKSNEITAIPKLLDVLAIKGAIVTIDAMGCQLDIAKKIIEIEAGYILALKRNQANLHDAIKHFLDSEIEDPESKYLIKSFKEVDYGHGRIEIRKCYVCDDIEWLENKDKWEGLQSICMIESERIVKGEKSIDRRYFISSLAADPKLHLHAVRSHWKIENTLHWTLDMVFREDESRIMDRNSSENMAIIRHMTMNYIKTAQKSYKKPISIKGLRKLAGWDPDMLDEILNAKF